VQLSRAGDPRETLEVGIRVERIGRSSFTHRYRVEAVIDERARGERGVGSPPEAERPTKADRSAFDCGGRERRRRVRLRDAGQPPLGDDFRKAIEAHQARSRLDRVKRCAGYRYMSDLKALFAPRSIAVIGAGVNVAPSRGIFHNLLVNDFQGRSTR